MDISKGDACMDKNQCIKIINNYICQSEWNITMDDINADSVVIKRNNLEHAVKIIGINNATIVSASKNLLPIVKREFKGKCRDMIFECPLSYGQTIFYIPNFKECKKLKSKMFDCKYYFNTQEIEKLENLESFENSITFNDNNECISKIAYVAYDKGKIVGCAGAIELYDGIYEMGIDVLPEYRNKGLATILTTNLRLKIQDMGIIPVWRSSITNIGSQSVAQKSGFVPYYISSFGTIGDGFYPYKRLMGIKKKFQAPTSRI